MQYYNRAPLGEYRHRVMLGALKVGDKLRLASILSSRHSLIYEVVAIYPNCCHDIIYKLKPLNPKFIEFRYYNFDKYVFI